MRLDATTTFDREGLLDEVVTAYLKEARAGRAPDPAAWQARYPELAADLAEFFADRAALERLAAPLRAVAPADPLAYLGRLARASARGTFSGTSGTFTFQSSAKPQKTIFGVLGTEQAGALLPGVASCGTCAAAAGPPAPW